MFTFNGKFLSTGSFPFKQVKLWHALSKTVFIYSYIDGLTQVKVINLLNVI